VKCEYNQTLRAYVLLALTGTLGLFARLEGPRGNNNNNKMLLRAARVNGLLGSVVHVPVRTIKRPALNTSQVYHYYQFIY